MWLFCVVEKACKLCACSVVAAGRATAVCYESSRLAISCLSVREAIIGVPMHYRHTTSVCIYVCVKHGYESGSARESKNPLPVGEVEGAGSGGNKNPRCLTSISSKWRPKCTVG